MGHRITTDAKGGFRAPLAYKVAGLTYRMGDHWATTDVVRPSIAEADGKGTARLYSFRDVVALRVVAELRRARLSLQRVRRCVEALRRDWPDAGGLSGARLLTDGREAYLALNASAVVALLDRPGQMKWRACVDVGRAVTEVREALKIEQRAAKQSTARRAAGGAR